MALYQWTRQRKWMCKHFLRRMSLDGQQTLKQTYCSQLYQEYASTAKVCRKSAHSIMSRNSSQEPEFNGFQRFLSMQNLIIPGQLSQHIFPYKLAKCQKYCTAPMSLVYQKLTGTNKTLEFSIHVCYVKKTIPYTHSLSDKHMCACTFLLRIYRNG